MEGRMRDDRRRRPRTPKVFLALLMLIVMLLRGSANRLFYYPTREIYGSPKSSGLAYEEVSFSSLDGTLLSGWFIPSVGPSLGTVVHYHGNAVNMTSHLSFVDWLPSQGFNLVTFDYRGYGRSEGKPTRAGTVQDGRAVLRWLRSRPDVDPGRVFLLGQSLGGAIGLASAGEGDATGVCGIAVDSTFVSYQGVARDLYAGIPGLAKIATPFIRWFVTEDHSPSRSLARLQGIPILILHGDKDEIVPYVQARRLYEQAPEPKRLLTVPGGLHTEAFVGRDAEAYRGELVDFFKSCLARLGDAPQPGGTR